MSSTKSMYVTLSSNGNMWELHQVRYKGMVPEHPHDVCAVARSIEELRSMVDKPGVFEGDVIWPESIKEAIK